MNPAISVVIPAYDRQEILDQCLARIAGQTLAADQYEVIVVDDGSPEPLRIAERAKAYRQSNKCPAAARNHGVRQATGDASVFIADDILVVRGFLGAHRDFRVEQSSPMEGALGLVVWPNEYLEAPYMHRLDRSGSQFGFRGLKDAQRLQYYRFYTANISLKRQTLLEHPFDED